MLNHQNSHTGSLRSETRVLTMLFLKTCTSDRVAKLVAVTYTDPLQLELQLPSSELDQPWGPRTSCSSAAYVAS